MEQSTAPNWYAKAREYLGTKEQPGSWQDNPVIVGFFDYVSYHATHDEVPWCSAFMNAVFAQVGIEGSGSAAAISWLHWGKRLQVPQLGCVAVFEHHVALYVSHEGNGLIKLLGGNQSDQVKESVFAESQVLSYRWPEGELA